jgi:hypothetical protein
MTYMEKIDLDVPAPAMRATSEPLLGGIGEKFVYEVWETAEGDFQLFLLELTDDTSHFVDEVLGTFTTLEAAIAEAEHQIAEQFV